MTSDREFSFTTERFSAATDKLEVNGQTKFVESNNLNVDSNGSLTPATFIPDSGIFRWSCENKNGDTSVVADEWGSTTGTVTSATYNSTGGDDGNGAYTADCDIESSLSVSGATSFSGWFYAPYSQGSGNEVVWEYGVRGFSLHYNNNNNTGGYELLVNNVSIASNVSTTQQYIHFVCTYDGSGVAEIYVNGSLENSASGLSDPPSSGPFYTSKAPVEGKNSNLRVSEMRQYDKKLSATEVSNLYSTGSING